MNAFRNGLEMVFVKMRIMFQNVTMMEATAVVLLIRSIAKNANAKILHLAHISIHFLINVFRNGLEMVFVKMKIMFQNVTMMEVTAVVLLIRSIAKNVNAKILHLEAL